MSKIANYLATHLRGEVLSGSGVRATVSKDGSILKSTPILVAYPYDTADVRKIAHFSWQLAQKGHVLPLTARGNGSSLVGAAIGLGAVISLPTHFNTIFEVDTKQKLVRLQPGVTVAALKQAMHTHGLDVPIDATNPLSTIGGAIANNTYGIRALKYGDTAGWTDQIEVVLSNGDILQTERLTKRQLSKKKGLSSFEGEIYRKLDALIDDNEEVIADLAKTHTSAGYGITKVKNKGQFDLTPLIAGAQGTLGIITEIILRLDAHHPHKEVVVAVLQSLDNIDALTQSILKYTPDVLEFVDGTSIERAGMDLKEILPDDDPDLTPAGVLYIELNDLPRKAKSKAKKLTKLIEKQGYHTASSAGDVESASELAQIYHRLIASLAQSGDEHKVASPVVEDALLPPSEVPHFVEAAHELAKKHRTKFVFSTHLGTGVVHAHAQIDLKNLSDRNKINKLIEEYYSLVIKHDGGIAGEYGEGRLRASQNNLQFNESQLQLFASIKDIFDTHGIFNPGVKLVDEKNTAKLDEQHASGKFADQLPRL